MDEQRLKRARIRAWRRGFREADLVLGRFADARLSTLNEGELGQFEVLLEQSDHDLWSWIVGSAPVPDKFDHALMAELRASAWRSNSAKA